MHELSIAQNILSIVDNTASQNNASIVNSIELEIGTFSGVEIDALEFALETLMQNSKLRDTQLTIDIIQGKGLCNECGNDFEMASMYAGCGNCSSNSVSILQGQELRVKAINVD